MNKEMKYIRVLVMMMALMWGAVSGAWAQLTASDIEYEVKPSASGTIEKSVNATTREVTLTVKPETGYFIKASDFVVEKLVNTGNANAPKRRVSDITNLITGKLYSGSGRAETDIISSVSYPNSAQYVFTLPADYDGAYVTATFHLLTENEIIRITRNSSIESPNMSGHYVLVEDVSASVVNAFYSAGTFTGTFEGEPKADGSFPTISGLEHALFQTVNGGGTVKNIVLDNVTIAGSTYYTSVTVGNQSKKATGAIANVATGASRIYNCGIQATGSSVTTDKDGYTLFSTVLDAEKKPQHTESSSTVGGVDYVGGLVGFLDGTARVINCYSYADITSGSFVGGIVGRNNVATTASNLKTMVMNCMFYGNLTSGNKAPIYNGEIITNVGNNTGVSNFNYFWAGAPYVQNRDIDTYNCALSAETRYMQRFEFFRHLLNGHRELAAWWVQGDGFEKDEMAKWVMEPSQIGTTTPYPILKAQGKYPSVVNYKPSDETIDANNEHYNEGRKLGTLSVTIRMGSNSPYDAPPGARLKSGQSMTLTLPITDKDPAHFNFNYGKVQLPYYNDYGIGNYTGNRVVTGWKIVAISGGTHGFSTGDDATASVNDNGDITLTTPYNFADRKCTDKDKFEVSGRVFSQGAYFDVPEGVSSIIIEPYWAKAVFLADASPDLVYDTNMETAYNVPNVGGNQLYTNGNSYLIAGESQVVYTTASTKDETNAITGLFSGINENTSKDHSVYDYAIVLVGNYHHYSPAPNNHNINGNKNCPYTLMSIDNDHDNEPDYSLILRYNNRTTFHPIRFDFLNIPGLGMAQKSTGGKGTYNLGIMQTLGWFESTNTSLFRFTQFEYDKVGRQPSPMILQGGVIEQWVTMGQKEQSTKEGKTVTYYHVGGNVWFKEFHIGVHQDKTQDEFVSPHPPISVTGGDYSEFYLTGMYNTPNNNYDDNAECYINGGRFGKVAGTGMQGIGGFTMSGTDKVSYSNGNITWQIDNADINEFYGGGINAAHIAEGNIMTVISNSRVDQFCGGPKFGNMNSDKKVVTNAANCIFRTFFGAGYGGNSYNRRYPDNQNNKINIDWNTWVQGNDGLKYRYDSSKGGVETRIDYQFLPMSSNVDNVCRLFVDYVSFSLATTHDVTSKLTDCTITTSPLGSLELFSQSVGNFYGGGNLGMVDGPVKSTLTNCTVEGNVFGGGYSATLPTVAVMNNSFKTEPFYDENLGAYLDAELPTTVAYTWQHRDEVNSTATAINTNDHILYTQENLTELGAVTGNVTLTIDGNTSLTNGKRMSVAKSVYGGGEESNVEGNTQVNITGGTITQNVFGGGKGEADEFSCSKAMIGVNDAGKCEDPGSDDNKEKGTKVTISNGIVNGNVYGGGEVGRVEWNTQVKIGVGTGNGPFAPVINGSVFGAGKGKVTHGYAALVRGNSTVTVQGNAKVLQNVYGGGEQATVGRYWVKGIPTDLCTAAGETAIPEAPSNTPDEMPYKTRRGGKSTVIVQGSAQVGPDSNVPITAGHVFGAGKGVTPNYVYTGDKANWSKRMVDYNSEKHTGTPGTTWDYYEEYTEAQIADTSFPKYVWEYFTTEDKYFEFLQTLALVTGTDVTIGGTAQVKGSVFGGSESGYVQDNTNVKVTGGTIGTTDLGSAYYGNVYGGGKGDAEHTGANQNYVAAGLVKGNTKVTISNGTILHNVYGGGAYGSVGQFTYDANTGMPTERVQNTTGGKAEVIIKGGTFGTTGSENGHVFTDAAVYIYSGTVGITEGEQITDDNGTPENQTDDKTYTGAAYPYRGNVYGSGCGTDKYYSGAIPEGHTATDGKGNKYNPLAGIVQGNTSVNISGGHVVHNVYGAGAMGSVGTANVATSGKTTITVTGGRIGYDGTNNEGNVFGAARGDLSATGDLAQVRETEVNINYTSTPDADNTEKTVQLIAGSVFGGGEAGTVKESVAVTMRGGMVLKDVYGGGALADTQTSNWNTTGGTWADADRKSTLYTTTVRLMGGTILGEAYGGALGEKTGVNSATSDIAAYVYGDVLLDLNGTTPIDDNTHKPSTTGTPTTNASGCVVDQIFGCNNINGSPKGDVMVHVYATQNKQTNTIAQKFILEKDSNTEKGGSESNADYVARLQGILTGKIALAEALSITVSQENKDLCTAENPTVAALTTAISGITTSINAKTTDEISGVRYDVEAVYGGGNMAAYVPVSPFDGTSGSKTQVIIEGCSKTSIETVYGGGNAAAVPETNVEIREAYEIQAVFGGGNGKDNLPNGDPNPGADIGQYHNGTEMVTYGTGNANSLMEGGYIHEAYGGSNTKGVVKGSLNQTSNPEGSTCDLAVDKIVGAGKYADIDGNVNMTLSCQPSSKVDLLFAGADEANVNGNITLNITNGHFGKVFGGNNLGGAVKGKITVNVEETGCQPIKIDELYLGGNQAAYSVFGYYESDEVHDVTGLKILKPRESATDARKPVKYDGTEYESISAFTNYAQPVLNIISCTYIGNVFGGGFGEGAVMYANPTVNVNMVKGAYGDNTTIGVPAVMTTLNLPSTENTGHLGIIENVFGGGDAADIYGTTTVNIATEANRGAYITGMVFGGGNNADVKGNTSVNMAGGYVKDRVYGGGKLGNVGTFTRKSKEDSGHNHDGNCMGKPDTWTANTGRCVVTVSGGQVGPLGMTMPEDYGYVFGAGRGETADPNVDVDVDFKTYVHDTRVIIKNTYAEGYATANDSLSHITKAPLICGGVYGGSEAGRVGNNTDVRIYGGQIGLGNGQTAAYTEAQWTAAVTAVTSGNASSIATAAQAMPECNSWTYDPTSPHNALPYDVHANDASYNAETIGAASTIGYDGHTFYGNVFGGGSGYFAYTGENVHGWLRSSGLVEGDTHVTISGGHILTSVYGGNELTDVNGKCYVKMTGGTLGVPRTLAQIAAHPVTCYLFGAGKGDQRIHFNTFTNVGAVDVNISGGTIFGSVFGGGEDGHVLGNVDLAVSGGHIGTWGTSYVDGNVFGGGRGFGGEALTAGVVQGNVDVTISDGTVLGSIYGGGRLGSVGTYLVPASHENYGKLIPDGKNQDYKNWDTSDNNFGKPVDATGVTHGHVTINISGGTIGNSYEYVIPTSTDNWTATDWNTWKTTYHIPNTEFGTTDTDKNRLMHTKGGNVFAGAMGRLYALNGSTILTYWADLGKAKQTEVTISGGNIKSNVYGGGELGAVVNGTKVSITGGIVGTEVTSTDAAYTYGSVFGGGYGSDANVTGTYTTVEEASTVSVKDWAGRVKGNTQVEMKSGTTTQGTVKASVYGGGELAWVDGTTQVTVTAGEIGKNELDGQNTKFGGYRMGNVYGGGKGSLDYVKAGLVTGNANVTINGTTTTPKIYHNIYGGGALGSVGTFTYDGTTGLPTACADNTGTATVKFIGGTVGINGHDNGMVNGSSRGGEGNPTTTPNLDRVAWVKNTVVEIGKNGNNEAENTNASVAIKGAVYGGGENGHNLQDAEISIYGGTIGNAEASTDFDCGNVYGAGCGTDTYTITSGTNTTEHHNPMAGCVRGTTSITVYGGNILRNIYGGGSMGSVGGNTAVTGAGKTTINIYGGVIGTTDNSSYGNVYGGPKGDHDETEFYASVRETLININAHPTDNTKPGANVKGSVFGGGEAGIVKEKVVVNMNGGEVKQDVYGGGALANTNTDNWGTDTWASGKSSASNTTTVNLIGGKIYHNVYGGGLGKMAVGTEGQSGYEPAIEAKVYGNTTVELNNEVDDAAMGCIVLGSIFGCNNLSGSPQGTTTVHIYKTQRDGATRITNTDSDKTAKVKGTKTNGEYVPSSFDVQAVYGGGNMAAFEPVDLTTGTTNVIIDGCESTSICHVYGGGNAASTPATNVTINGTYEIGELFGGGNGKDDIVKNSVTLPNPGANVGYKDYSEYYQDGTIWKVKDKSDAETKDKRLESSYVYGTGVATVNVFGGLVHRVFGGSNTKGNVRQTAVTLLEESGGCEFCVDEAYGGGKSAEMDAEAKLLMACIPGLEAAYGGAEAADVQGNVTLTITNGTFNRVFGGNNISGTISGKITVNVEETGCRPVVIGELYGGGNLAAYSIYGYKQVNDEWKPRTSANDEGTGPSTPYDSPHVNVRSFTSIGSVYGGGYGAEALMVASPTVNISESVGDPDTYPTTGDYNANGFKGKTITVDGHDVVLPAHTKNKIGAIGDVFGGGNAAPVMGDTHVNIGTLVGEDVYLVKAFKVGSTLPAECYTKSGSDYVKATGPAQEGTTYYRKYPVVGVDIRGNVYGGGNNAEVTGNTNVNIGKKVE